MTSIEARGSRPHLFELMARRQEIARGFQLNPGNVKVAVETSRRWWGELNDFLTDERLISQLKEIKTISEQEEGRKLSRPYICALLLRGIAEAILDKAEGYLYERNLSSFALFYDMAEGGAYVAGHILLVDDVLREGEDALAEGMAQLIPTPLDDKSLVVNALSELTKTLAGDTIRVLGQDLTGYSLVDGLVESLKDGTSESPTEVRELMVEGAILARNLYKRAYPLTENL
ncbi:MAG: hypothetical protein A2868_01365 [Candidatus Levybacteria bacterium RIFCSPHIGHO2_01_FULL_40_15b]|nr:MAG: hypothetical protein A2868_01365 [Candidatus Levybacteria bacterium RIFCSPHIGHO2_01_FULL_40_15b]